MITDRIERIKKMENAIDRVAAAFRNNDPLSISIQSDLKELANYYQTEWISDYEADEHGELPPELKRGILSEDALYDLLCDADRKKKSNAIIRKEN